MRPRPPWLEELSDLLRYDTEAVRRRALRAWQARWLVDLQVWQRLTEESIAQAGVDVVALASDHVRAQLGRELGALMVTITTEPSEIPDWAGMPLVEVRGTVLALRREPKTDD